MEFSNGPSSFRILFYFNGVDVNKHNIFIIAYKFNNFFKVQCCLPQWSAFSVEYILLVGGLCWMEENTIKFIIFACTGMELMWGDTLHGHYWTTLSGLKATPSALVWFMWIIRMVSLDIRNLLPIGSHASWKVVRRKVAKKTKLKITKQCSSCWLYRPCLMLCLYFIELDHHWCMIGNGYSKADLTVRSNDGLIIINTC